MFGQMYYKNGYDSKIYTKIKSLSVNIISNAEDVDYCYKLPRY